MSADHKEAMVRTIAVAMFNEMEAKLLLQCGKGTVSLTGVLTKVDKETKRLLVHTRDGLVWVDFDGILNVSLAGLDIPQRGPANMDVLCRVTEI